MIFDTHAHCYWDSLEPQIEQVIARMKDQAVVRAVQIGCDIPTSRQAIALAERFPDVFVATVWLHPETAQERDDYRTFFVSWWYDLSDFDAFLDTIDREDDDAWERIFSSIPLLQDMDILLQTSRMYIVAIGECGMDFHYIDGTDIGKIPFDRTCISERARRQIEHQKFWWLAQWKLAKKYHLPVVIHTRDAREETVTYMKRYGIDHAVMHCYAENPDMAQALMDFSPRIYFSFSGILTYKNARSVQETAKMLPLSRILLETDAPFLAPQPVRGTLCEPAFTRYTLDGLCALRDEDPSVIESCVYENSLRFFGMAS